MTYEIYTTDTAATLSGGDLAKGEWQEFESKSSLDSRKSASYAVRKAMDAAFDLARTMMREQGIVNTPYRGVDRPIEDDGRIHAAVMAIREAVAARAAKLAQQAPAPQYACAGAADGCQARVHTPRTYCTRCQHDED